MNEFQRMMRRVMMILALAALLPAAVSAAHADAPIAIEPDGETPLNDSLAESTDDDDPPIPPDATSEEFYVYVSAPATAQWPASPTPMRT